MLKHAIAGTVALMDHAGGPQHKPDAANDTLLDPTATATETATSVEVSANDTGAEDSGADLSSIDYMKRFFVFKVPGRRQETLHI
jgi:hypothetical protein